MSQEIRKVHTTDNRTLISMILKQPNTSGVLTAVDLTGLSTGAVQFEMFNAADGTEVIALTSTGVTFSSDTSGLVHYQFTSPMSIAAGYYNGFFVLTESTLTDHFPIVPGELRIEVSDHAQTAQAAYRAAVAV